MNATQTPSGTRRSRNPAKAASVLASAPQPAAPPPTERRHAMNRRASDKPAGPVVDIDALAANAEATVKRLLSGAMDRAVHKGVQIALQQTVAGATASPAANDATAPAAAAESTEPPVVRNGVRCPDYGTVTGRLWLLYGKAGAGVTLTQAKALAEANGMNAASAAIALYNWRKFHGVPNPQ